MASELLKTLNKIDSDRLNLINAANEKGANLDLRSSFNSLIPYLSTDPYPDYAYLFKSDDWVRPTDWPDCHNILRSAEDKEGYSPGTIFLFDENTSYEMTLPKFTSGQTGLNNGANNGHLGARGYLLSDGTWYGDTTNAIVHTWNKDLDIIGDNGKRYRWLILYVNRNESVGFINYTQLPAIEILVGNVGKNGGGFFCTSQYTQTSAEACSKTIKSIEFLQECPDKLIAWGWGSNPSKGFITGFTELEHVEINNILTISNDGRITNVFGFCPKLKHLDLGDSFPTQGASTFYIALTNDYSLKTFKYNGVVPIRIFGSLPSLELLEAPNSAITFGGYSTMYINKNAKIECGGIKDSSELPLFWSNTRGLKFINVASSVNMFTGTKDVVELDLSTADTYHYASNILTYPNNTNSSDSVLKFGPAFPLGLKLKSLKLCQGFHHRIDISRYILPRSIIVDIIDKLADFGENTTVLAFIRVNTWTYNNLLEEDLEAARLKGWSIDCVNV